MSSEKSKKKKKKKPFDVRILSLSLSFERDDSLFITKRPRQNEYKAIQKVCRHMQRREVMSKDL